MSSALVFYESHFIDIPLNSWWVYSRASVHKINSLQGIRNKRKPNRDNVSLFIGKENEFKLKRIGDISLS